MTPLKLTAEQQAIIHHPLGKHARVLAVAGSGKTTTMVQRVKYLVEDLNQNPATIRVVMFNRLAREQFERKLAEVIFEKAKRPGVRTFHSLAYSLRSQAEKMGLIPRYHEQWIGDKSELQLICMRRAIDSLLQDGILENGIKAQIALDAVGLWKASLIPPERAGHRTNLDLPDVYRRYEELREEARALTFDDFIPKAFELLEKNERFVRSLTNRIDHLIVDEYQDINYGQQRLIQLLAGERADVMVVGDDDQTIYEWRAARPYYILEGFQEDFANKPVVDYTLSRSFRFGPLLAQVAYNMITHNEKRNVKPLVAHDVRRETGVEVLANESEQATNVAVSMADEISTLVRSQRVRPGDIVALGRTFVQIEGLQAVFVERSIPFRVLGMAPFFERDENRTLIDYLRLALALEQPIGVLKPWRQSRSGVDAEEPAQARNPSHYRHTNLHKGPYGETVRAVLAVANTPSRRLPRKVLASAVKKGGDAGFSLWQVFDALLDICESPISEEGRENLREWMDLLMRVGERVQNEPDLKAGELLGWLVESLDYYEHFTSYYGEGSPSGERISAVRNFVNFAVRSGKAPRDFISYLSHLDTTFGLTANQVITMTTVHRTKGLEYDYVFIPTCLEGHMPVHIADEVAIYDKEGIVPDQPLSPALESERRLFYVAITRARKHLFIGTMDSPKGGSQAQSSSPLPSRFIEEMEVDATKEVVRALWKALDGDDRRLQAVVRESKARRQVIESVVGSYLQPSIAPHVGQIPSFQEALARMPDQPFQYSHEYPALEVLSTRSKAEEVEPVEWEDPWAGIGDF